MNLLKGIVKKYKGILKGSRLKIFYAITLIVILLMEELMAFYFPIRAKEVFGSNIGVGLVISLTNICAILCDFLIPQFFRKKTWKFLMVIAVILQIFYPTFTQLGVLSSSVIMISLAGLFWNIYFEFFCFSRHSFVSVHSDANNYAKSWGIISIISGFASIIGPIYASYLLDLSLLGSSVHFIIIQSIALVLTFILVNFSPRESKEHLIEEGVHVQFGILKTIKIMGLLGLRFLPVIVLGALITLRYSAMLTVAGPYGKELLGGSNLEWLIIFVYNVPSILVPVALSRIKIKKFKKFLSQISLIIAGFFYCMVPVFANSTIMILTLIFVSSIFGTIGWILNQAVYSDLTSRSTEHKLHIGGIERINDAIGSLIGPIIAGSVADMSGYAETFRVIGLIGIIASILLLIFAPRKIRVPHKKLESI